MGRTSKRASKIRQGDEFSTARLAREVGAPKDGTSAVFAWSLEDIYAARNAQMRGDFRQAARLAESMRTDDALFVAYANRLDPLACVGVELVPASDKGKAVSVAAEAEALFGQEGIGIAPGALADIEGCFVNHGVAFACVTMTPREDGSRIDASMRYWPIEFVRWDAQRRCFVTRVDTETVTAAEYAGAPGSSAFATFEVPIVHGDGRWIIFSTHEHEPFKQTAAILPAAIVWARHAFAARDWSKGSVAHGAAKVVGEMPAGVALQEADGDGNQSLTAEAAAFLALLRSIASGDAPVGIRPAGSKTEFVTNTSTAWQVWAELVSGAEKASARIYLGTDGTLGSQGGAPGVDVTALFGVALTKVKGDAECIERALLTGLIEPWCALNFGDSSLAPTRRYMLPDADEEAWRASEGTRRQAFYADVAAARSGGFVISQDFVDAVAKVHDVTAPTLPEETDAKAPTIALAPTDLARVITVNEARASAGLDVLELEGKPDPDGLLTVEAFGAKQAAKLAALAAVPSPTPAIADGP